MSTFTKTLVVLVFVASGILMGVVATLYAYRTDYKAALAKVTAEKNKVIGDREADIVMLQTDLALRESQAIALKNAIGKLETGLSAAQNDAKNWQDKHSMLMTDLGKLTEQFKVISDQIGEKDKVIQELANNLQTARSELEAAQKDKDNAEQHALDLAARLQQAEKNLIEIEKAYVSRVKESEGK